MSNGSTNENPYFYGRARQPRRQHASHSFQSRPSICPIITSEKSPDEVSPQTEYSKCKHPRVLRIGTQARSNRRCLEARNCKPSRCPLELQVLESPLKLQAPRSSFILQALRMPALTASSRSLFKSQALQTRSNHKTSRSVQNARPLLLQPHALKTHASKSGI